MFSARLYKSLTRFRIVMNATLAVALLVLAWGIPQRAEGAGINGSAFSDFSAIPESTVYFSGYYLGSGNYTKETPAFHFVFTPADNLQAGETIQIMLPPQYNFVGNTAFFWSANTSVPAASLSTKVDAAPSSLFDTVTTQLSPEWQPMLSFHLSAGISAGAFVDIRVANFLITPDYHYKTAGLKQYAISTLSNTTRATSNSPMYARSVANYYPDADSYAASAVTGYHFKFMVMQQLPAETSSINITFPTEMTLPSSVDRAHVKINGAAAGSATVSGNQLIVEPSSTLSSFSDAVVDIDPAAQIANPSAPGYYSFLLGTSVDPLQATRRIGIISAAGASLADNPSHDRGYVSPESDGTLRFRLASPTILKGGDTVTVSSPPGTMLTDPSISPSDVRVDLVIDGPSMDSAPASMTRLADNKLQFVLPSDYYLDPDYSLVFKMPNLFKDHYGVYDLQVSTSKTVIPSTVPLIIAPDTIQNFTATAGTIAPGASNVPYTFRFQTNLPLSADNADSITIRFPAGLTVPNSINASSITMNGLPVPYIYYSSFDRSLSIRVPENIPLLGTVEVGISGDAGLTNPGLGTYTFRAYPGGDSSMLGEASIEYKTVTGITASPKPVLLQLGSTVSRQLAVVEQMSDSSIRDVTSATYGTTYSSSNAQVATVTANGLVEAKQAGAAVITVTNNGFADTVNVTVAEAQSPPPVVRMTGIAASPKPVLLQLGGTVSRQLAVTAQMSDSTTQDVTSATYGTIYSSNAAVATVTVNGLIEAKQAGAAVITVTNNVYADTVNVTVSAASEGSGNSGGSGSSTSSTGSSNSGASTTPAQTPETESIEQFVIASEGGTVELPRRGSIMIPAGALPSDGKIRISVLHADQAPPASEIKSLSPVVEFASSTGSNLNKPTKLSLQFDASQVGAGLKPAVYYYNKAQERWLYIGGSVSGSGTISVETNHFGSYAVFAVNLKSFTDMKNHWAAVYVDRLVGRGIIQGFEDHTFRPEEAVTRAQLVKMIADALALKKAAAPSVFTDRDALPDWAKDSIASAVQAGVIQGYEEKGAPIFKPDQPVTRAEMAVIMSRVLKWYSIGATKSSAVYADQRDIPDWAQSGILTISGQKIASGYPDGSFRPGGKLTRAEAAKMIYMLLEALHI